MTWISKNFYINKLDDIVPQYNNAYHSTIKMKPADAKLSTYILTLVEKLMKNQYPTNFKIVGIDWIPKYKIIFTKSYVPN